MKSTELAKELKSRFPANVVQFHTNGEDIEVRPTLKDEVFLTYSDDKIILHEQDDDELANFEVNDDDLADKIEKQVRKYILS